MEIVVAKLSVITKANSCGEQNKVMKEQNAACVVGLVVNSLVHDLVKEKRIAEKMAENQSC